MITRPRIAPLAPDELGAEQQRLLSVAGSEKNIFTTLVRHPQLFEVFIQLAVQLMYRSGLPDHAKETLILRTARRCGAEYVWAQHVEIAREVGLHEHVIAAVGTEHPEPADEHLALLISAADQLTVHHGLDDPTWAALRQHYDDQQLIELCMLVGEYAMVAGVLTSLRVPLEPGQEPPDWS
jgi:4-carboxymuconolactone decarboxylase